MGLIDRAKNKAKGEIDKVKNQLLESMPDADSFGLDKDEPEDDSVATLYPDSRFRGKPTKLKAGRYTYESFLCGNDAVSSVRVKSGYKVILFQHVDFKGRMREITEDTANLGSMNDQASSAVVEKL